MARRKKEQPVAAESETTSPAEATPVVPTKVEAEPVAPPEPPVVVASNEPEPPPAPPAPTRWKVLADVRVSLYGHMTYLTRGTVVSVNEYGPDGIARLVAQEVALEPMV